MRRRVQKLPETVISRCLKYLREEAKAPWDYWTANCAAGNGHLHILEYLVERKYDQFTNWRVGGGHGRPLGLFEVLARNRQSALGRLGRILRAQEQPPRMCTIPPRQQLSIYHPVGDTSMENCTHRNHHLNHHKHIHLTYLLYSTLIRIFFTRFPSDTHPTQQKGDTIRE